MSKRNEIKTRRVWKPNVRSKQLWSEALQRFVRVKVVARVQRTIEKVGGLDNYLLGHKTARIRELGMAGWALRWRIMRTESVRERLLKERKDLGLKGRPPWEGIPVTRAVGGLRYRSRSKGRREVASQEDEIEEAERLQMAIDEDLDADDEATRRGEDGGFELVSNILRSDGTVPQRGD